MYDLYTCKGKGGLYEVLGLSRPAGQMKTVCEDNLVFYRCLHTGKMYHRNLADFDERMQRIDEALSSEYIGDDSTRNVVNDIFYKDQTNG